MLKIKKLLFICCFEYFISFFAITAMASGISISVLPNLGTGDTEKLYSLMIDYYTEQITIENRLETALLNLDRKVLLTKENQANSENFNRTLDSHIRQAAGYYGELMRLKIKFAAKGKAILPTKDTDTLLFSILDFEVRVIDTLLNLLDFSFPFFEIDLPKAQMSKLLYYQTVMEQNLIKLELEQKKLVLDLREQIFSSKPNSVEVERIISRIEDNCVQIIKENINYKSSLKRELTPQQTKKLFQILVLTPSDI